MHLVLDDLVNGYVDLVEHVRAHGKKTSPRGYKTWEVEDATFTIADPLNVLPIGVGRNLNPAIAAAEAMLLCGGISDPTLLTGVSATFKRFLDGGILHGGYGWRIRPQLDATVRRLLDDPDTRQAIITIWDPLYDCQTPSPRDLPCTLNFGFRIRNGRLNMSTTMRSNDVWLGTAYDIFCFTQLQATISNALNIPVGTYTHHAYSLHIYERNLNGVDLLHYFAEDALTEKEIAATGVTDRGILGFGDQAGPGWDDSLPEWPDHIFGRARQIHAGELPDEPSPSEEWYLRALAPYPRLTATANFAS